MTQMGYFYNNHSIRMKLVLAIAYENVLSQNLSAYQRYKPYVVWVEAWG
jgi:hypothetical protein